VSKGGKGTGRLSTGRLYAASLTDVVQLRGSRAWERRESLANPSLEFRGFFCVVFCPPSGTAGAEFDLVVFPTTRPALFADASLSVDASLSSALCEESFSFALLGDDGEAATGLLVAGAPFLEGDDETLPVPLRASALRFLFRGRWSDDGGGELLDLELAMDAECTLFADRTEELFLSAPSRDGAESAWG